MTQIEMTTYIESTFDSFAKTVIRNHGISLFRKYQSECIRYPEMNWPDFHEPQHSELDPVIEHPSVFCVCDYSFRVYSPELAAALQCLKPKLRDVILLTHFGEMKIHEIASLLNIPKSTVHDRKMAALKRLRIHLKGMSNNEQAEKTSVQCDR